MPRPIIAIQKYDSSMSDAGKDKSHHSVMKYEFISTRASYINSEVSISTYIGYYIASLLYNALLLAFYVIQVFSYHHVECLNRAGLNVTDRFEFMFKSGLVLLGADIVNTNMFNIYYRFKVQQEERELGMSC